MLTDYYNDDSDIEAEDGFGGKYHYVQRVAPPLFQHESANPSVFKNKQSLASSH